jgi:two-component system LytT family response regulator
MIRTLIIDDEPLIRENTEALLQTHPDILVVGTAGSVAEGTVMIRNTKPDLLLLDIRLGDGTGFELVDRDATNSPAIVFITAYNDQAIRAIRVGALDYLLKPLDEDELAAALEKVRAHRNNQTAGEQIQLAKRHLQDASATDRIALREQHSVHIVQHKDIIYCEADRSYTHFHLEGGRTLVISGALKDFADVLPEPMFLRTHQSYLVNRNCVMRYERSGVLHLKNGVAIPVAVRKRDEVLHHLIGGKGN